VLIVPVGSGPTIGGEPAAELVRSLAPRLVVPMHYRTPAINFLEPPDAFLDALGARVERLETSEATVDDLLGDGSAPTVALLAPPTA
jgi:L-ascorbate metabolism protein UlaG (beta-lactamase superfamily)